MSESSVTVVLFAAAHSGVLLESSSRAACGDAGEPGCSLGRGQETSARGPCEEGLVECGCCEHELCKTSCYRDLRYLRPQSERQPVCHWADAARRKPDYHMVDAEHPASGCGRDSRWFMLIRRSLSMGIAASLRLNDSVSDDGAAPARRQRCAL
jgi:hypothetical protein